MAELGTTAQEFSLHSPELLSTIWSRSLLLQISFVQAAGHMATGLSGFPAFPLVTREERSVQLSASAQKVLGKSSEELSMGHAVPPGSEKGWAGSDVARPRCWLSTPGDEGRLGDFTKAKTPGGRINDTWWGGEEQRNQADTALSN